MYQSSVTDHDLVVCHVIAMHVVLVFTCSITKVVHNVCIFFLMTVINIHKENVQIVLHVLKHATQQIYIAFEILQFCTTW